MALIPVNNTCFSIVIIVIEVWISNTSKSRIINTTISAPYMIGMYKCFLEFSGFSPINNFKYIQRIGPIERMEKIKSGVNQKQIVTCPKSRAKKKTIISAKLSK